MRITKKVYEKLKKLQDARLNETEKYLTGLATALNLKEISKDDYDEKMMNWETESFAIDSQVWFYECRIAFNNYDRREKEFIENNRIGFIDLINLTPSKEKYNFRLKEKINKLHLEVASESYKLIGKLCKKFPVHEIDKDLFPVPPIELTKDL